MRRFLLLCLGLLLVVVVNVSGVRVDQSVVEFSTYLDNTYQVIAFSPSADGLGFNTRVGTAVMVKYHNSEYVVTAGHVCTPDGDRPLTFELMSRYGNVAPTTVRGIDKVHDLCVLNTTLLLPGGGLPLYADFIDFGDSVKSVGSPLGVYPVPTHGDYMGKHGDLLAASIPATSGCSGAGLFYRGKIIGIIVMATGGFNQIALAVPADVVAEFLGSL